MTWEKRDKKWRAQLNHDKKRHSLGYYKLETDAALAHDEAAKQLKGPNTETNFASLKDYEKAKANELVKSGLSNENATTSSAIIAKVKQAISKQNSKRAGKSVGVGFSDGNEETEDESGWEDNTAVSTSTSTKKKKKSSEYVGVSYDKKNKRWMSQLMHDKKPLRLGYYTLETDAALAYDVASKQMRGSGARTNFTGLNDYEKGKKNELAKTGLSNDDAMTSSAIEAKVNEILRTSASIASAKTVEGGEALEEDLLKATSISLASPEDEDNAHSTKSAQLAALNNALAKKWAPYLPSMSGKDFLVGYQKSINGIIQQDLKPKANKEDVPTVSVDNVPTSTRTGLKINETFSAAESLTTMHNENDTVPRELPDNSTAEESCTQKMSNASPRCDGKQKPTTAKDAHLSQAKSLEGAQSSTTGTVLSTTSTTARLKQAKKPQLTRLTNSQVAELSLPYPVGCPVWSQFGEGSNVNSVHSFRTGIVTGVFMDFSAIGGFFYQVEFVGGEETKMVPDSQLCYAPRCPVTITSNDTTEIVQGEVLMGRAKSREGVTLLLKECLIKEQSTSNSRDISRLNQRLQDILDKLGTIQMTRHILASTYIGKSVKQLVTYHGGNNAVAHKARDLVTKWKAIAVAEKNQATNANTDPQNEICAFSYTILITKGGNQFHVEENVPSERVKYIRNEEQESSNSTITTATGLY